MYVCINPDVPEGELPVDMFPRTGGLSGSINLSVGYITIQDDDDARRLIAAAGRLIAMRATAGTPHPFEPSRDEPHTGVLAGHCVHCGLLGKWEAHAEPVITDSEPTGMQSPAPVVRVVGAAAPTYGLCPSGSPLGNYGCTLEPGHGGPHQSVEPLTGKARAEWAAAS